MLKYFHLTAVLWAGSILFIAETAFSLPLTTGDKYPVALSSDTDMPVCYMQTGDGRTLNLSSLCRDQPRPQSQSAQSQLVISDLRHEGDQMSGRVVNNTGKTLHDAKVNFEVIGENGSVVDEGVIYTDQQTLNPGQTASFNTFMPSGTNVRITSIE